MRFRRDGSREEYRDTIGSMLEEVNRLTALVDSLLTISRADAGRIQLHPTVFSAMDLAREAAGLFEVLIEEKGQQITVEGDEEVNVNGRSRVSEAGACEYHSQCREILAGRRRDFGESASTSPRGTFGWKLPIAVRGSRRNMPRRIFDRFYRVDESRSREAGGAGLGLSIAQWAVRVHGGDIHLLTAQGQGCTFQICLPMVAAPARHDLPARFLVPSMG